MCYLEGPKGIGTEFGNPGLNDKKWVPIAREIN